MSSVGGAVFELGSATYAITRVLTGQLDAYVDIGPAIIAAHPATEAEFRRVGRGHVLCNSPYDLAAAWLLCREAGVPMTDADGSSLERPAAAGQRRRLPARLHRVGQRRPCRPSSSRRSDVASTALPGKLAGDGGP